MYMYQYTCCRHQSITWAYSFPPAPSLQLVSSRSKLDARVSELQTQLTETQLQLSRSRDQREQLGNQLITMEGKLVKVGIIDHTRSQLVKVDIIDHTRSQAGQGRHY